MGEQIRRFQATCQAHNNEIRTWIQWAGKSRSAIFVTWYRQLARVPFRCGICLLSIIEWHRRSKWIPDVSPVLAPGLREMTNIYKNCFVPVSRQLFPHRITKVYFLRCSSFLSYEREALWFIETESFTPRINSLYQTMCPNIVSSRFLCCWSWSPEACFEKCTFKLR